MAQNDSARPGVQRRIATNTRFGHIDGLRAIAALLVVIHHLLRPIVEDSGQQSTVADAIMWLSRSVDFGRMGVNLFFLVSGYVIGQSICKYKTENTRMFLVSRVFRLYPVYWFSIALAYLAYDSDGQIGRYFVNLTMLQDFIGVKPVMGVYWTLTVELVFYTMCIVFFWLRILDRPGRVIFVFGTLTGYATIAAIVRYVFDFPLPYAWAMFLSLFVAGVVLRHRDDRKDAIDWRFWSVVAVYLAASLLIALAIYHDPQRYQKTWHAEFGASAGAVLMFVLINWFKPRLGPLVYIGVISYSVYLFHSLVGRWTIDLLGYSGLSTTLPWFVSFALTLALVLVFSSMTYRFIEWPAVGLGRRLQRSGRRGGAIPADQNAP